MLLRYFLLSIFVVVFSSSGVQARTGVSTFYTKLNKESKREIFHLNSSLYPENYFLETLLIEEQVDLLYPDVENLYPTPEELALGQAKQLVLGSEERLLSMTEEEVFDSFLEALDIQPDVLYWGEANDDLANLEGFLIEEDEDTFLPDEYSSQIPANISKKQVEHLLAPYNDVKMSINKKRVDTFIHFYTRKKRRIFLTGLKRAPIYYKMVKRIFQDYGVPHDLFYLAMVESNFNYKAVSKARAVGLWQFISSTGKSYGMNYSRWHDDKLDPEKATHAAAQFLNDLYKKYGDWALVLAAYNSGTGNVNRAIRKNRRLGKPVDYWSLELPKETRGYVPAFLAVVHIFNNLEYYDFPLPEKLLDWKKHNIVSVKPSVSFQQISEKTSLTVTQIKEYNPSLKYAMTPYRKKYFPLKVPNGVNITQEQLSSLKSDISDKFVTYRVVKGDTLWSIARGYQVSINSIYLSNPPLRNKKYLKPNQKIIIPISKDVYAEVKKKQKTSKKRIHTVRKGESLWFIARKYGTSVNSIIRKNYNIRSANDIIRVGTKITI